MFCKVVIYFGILLASGIVLAENRADHAYRYSTARTFHREIAKKDHFVMFYMKWCGWSQVLLPAFEQLAERMNGIYRGRVRIAKVDCQAASTICSLENISAYPTLRYYKRVNSRTWYWGYNGNRDLESLISAVNFAPTVNASLR